MVWFFIKANGGVVVQNWTPLFFNLEYTLWSSGWSFFCLTIIFAVHAQASAWAGLQGDWVGPELDKS